MVEMAGQVASRAALAISLVGVMAAAARMVMASVGVQASARVEAKARDPEPVYYLLRVKPKTEPCRLRFSLPVLWVNRVG